MFFVSLSWVLKSGVVVEVVQSGPFRAEVRQGRGTAEVERGRTVDITGSGPVGTHLVGGVERMKG